MNNCAPEHIAFLVIVAGRKQKNALLDILLKMDCRIVNTLYGKSSIRAGHLADMLGFVSEENKVVITCILHKEKAEGILETLKRDFHFDKPNTGIAFTIPISGISL
jgi:hypothetical protein